MPGLDYSDKDPQYSPPDVDVDQAGRGGKTLEGEPGIHVVKSISQDDYMDYSNKSDHGHE